MRWKSRSFKVTSTQPASRQDSANKTSFAKDLDTRPISSPFIRVMSDRGSPERCQALAVRIANDNSPLEEHLPMNRISWPSQLQIPSRSNIFVGG
jgi:hypothetical protein